MRVFSPYSKLPTMNEARAMAQAGRWEEAERVCRALLQSDDRKAEAWDFLGYLLQSTRRPEEAEACLERAAALKPSKAEYANNLAQILRENGKLEASVEHGRRAVRLDPGCGGYRYTLGQSLQGLGRLGEAEAVYREAVRLAPGLFDAFLNLGNVLLAQRKATEAEAAIRHAMLLSPANPLGPLNLGAVLQAQLRPGDALAQFERARTLAPGSAFCWSNLGTALQDQGRVDEALRHYEQALRLDPAFAQARLNRACCLFLKGDVRTAFREFEQIQAPKRAWDRPRWDGSSFVGRTLLLHCEQGLGDSIQFIRFIRHAQALGGRVVLECQPQLARLFRWIPGLEAVVGHGEALPEHDLQCSLMSLPALLGLGLEDLGLGKAILEPPAASLESWRQRLNQGAALRIGLIWQGNPDHRLDAFRSLPLAILEPLLGLEGVQVYSLQKGFGQDQVRPYVASGQIIDLSEALTDWTETAAAMRALDLFIGIDSGPVHLAGTLGVSTWLLNPLATDWRWFLDREDSPWYPSLRIFRQGETGGWEAVVGRLRASLVEMLNASNINTSSACKNNFTNQKNMV